MELARFVRAMEDLGWDQGTILSTAKNWQIFMFLVLFAIAVAIISFAIKKLVAPQMATSDLGSGLAEIDPVVYDFNGQKKPVKKPSADFDDFFSNASRREELGGAASASQAPDPAEDTVFPVPALEDLPPPDPNEPELSREARVRLREISSQARAKREADPSYVYSDEEQIASAAIRSYRSCTDGLYLHVVREPDVPTFRNFAKATRTIGAADLAMIIELQIKLMEMTSAPEWRERDEDDERWHPIQITMDQLSDLFRAANRSDGGLGRMSTLADAYLSGNR